MPNLTEIKDWVSIALIVVAIVLFVFSWILKKSKNKKLQEVATKLESAAATALAIKNTAQTAVALAEQFIDYSGEDKKQWAKTYIKEYCIEHGISYSDDTLDSVIEELIGFSKKVNATEQKRIEEEEAENV